MGYRISLVSMPLKEVDSVLQSLGLKPSEESDLVNDTPVSGASNGDKYLIWVNDDHHMMTHENLIEASEHCELLVLRANETVMYSEVSQFENCQLVWTFIHDSEQGVDHLEVWRSPPAEWQSIADSLREEHKGDEEVDYAFEAPVTLFQQLTGFRYDGAHDLPFVTLERSN
jgi:hypothetical protein